MPLYPSPAAVVTGAEFFAMHYLTDEDPDNRKLVGQAWNDLLSDLPEELQTIADQTVGAVWDAYAVAMQN